VIFNYCVYLYFRNKDEAFILNTIHYCGAFMLVMEVIKQIFCYYYVFDQKINLWFFPWQLCSMAMYCSFFITYVNRRIQNAFLIFLSTYSLIAAIIALAVPADMLRPQIYLTCYSFLYHFLMISLSILSIMIMRNRSDLKFSDSVILFLSMATVAEIINIVSHKIFHDIHVEPDMFYITPYYPTTQPVFNFIAVKFGILTEVVIYLGLIILSSYLIYRLIRKKI
jgi:hypothetical protein